MNNDSKLTDEKLNALPLENEFTLRIRIGEAFRIITSAVKERDKKVKAKLLATQQATVNNNNLNNSAIQAPNITSPSTSSTFYGTSPKKIASKRPDSKLSERSKKAPLFKQKKKEEDKYSFITAQDLAYVLIKIKAPPAYRKDIKEIVWEVDENGTKKLTREELEIRVQALLKEERDCFDKGTQKSPSRFLNIIDFVSKDKNLSGYISARQSILLLHNRFGGFVKPVQLKNLLLDNHCSGSSTIGVCDYIDHVHLRYTLRM